MARVLKTFTANSRSALVTAVNAYLAGLTNPVVKGFSVEVLNLQRRLGFEYVASISTETGGLGLATPFLLGLYEDTNLSTLETTVQAFLTTNAGYFVSSVRTSVLDGGPLARRYFQAFLYNTTGGASANYSLT